MMMATETNLLAACVALGLVSDTDKENMHGENADKIFCFVFGVALSTQLSQWRLHQCAENIWSSFLTANQMQIMQITLNLGMHNCKSIFQKYIDIEAKQFVIEDTHLQPTISDHIGVI